MTREGSRKEGELMTLELAVELASASLLMEVLEIDIDIP